MDEEQLIHLVEMRSCLYDTSSFHYKSLDKISSCPGEDRYEAESIFVLKKIQAKKKHVIAHLLPEWLHL